MTQAEIPNLITEPTFEFLLRIVLPGLDWYTLLDDAGNPERWGAADVDTGSWLTLNYHNDMATIQQGGPQQLWPTIQALYQNWSEAGHPSHDHYGITITPEGIHSLWLTRPDNMIHVLESE